MIASLMIASLMIASKPRRGEKFSGGECLGRGIFPRQFGRGGFGGENLKIFPAGGEWRGFCENFSPPGEVWRGFPHQNIQIPRQKYKFLAKIHRNEPIPRHGEKKVKIFPAGAGLARKKSSFSPHGVKWRGENLIPGPGDFSPLPAPPRNTPKNEPPEKKTPWLSLDVFPVFGHVASIWSVSIIFSIYNFDECVSANV